MDEKFKQMLREDFARDCIKGTPLEDHVKEIRIVSYERSGPELPIFGGLDDPVRIEIHLKDSFPRRLLEGAPSGYPYHCTDGSSGEYGVELVIGENNRE